MTQGGDEGQWWPREVVMKGSGDEGSVECDFGKWWRREVVTKGVWWLREVVMKGVWWRREVVRKGSGAWWELVTKGSGDWGKWWGSVVTKGTGDEGSVDFASAPLCSATTGCSCVCSSMRFLNLWLQISMEWLHDCCHLVLPCGLATWCCKTHCNGCMDVAWGLCWGGSRRTKLCVFPCKLAAGGDERYLFVRRVRLGSFRA